MEIVIVGIVVVLDADLMCREGSPLPGGLEVSLGVVQDDTGIPDLDHYCHYLNMIFHPFPRIQIQTK